MADAVDSIPEMVSRAIKSGELSVSSAARQWGVHRNFLIDLMNGKMPRVREGSHRAHADPRYANVANGIGVDIKTFCDLAESNQRRGQRVTAGLVDIDDGVLVIRISRQTLALAPLEMRLDLAGAIVTISVHKK